MLSGYAPPKPMKAIFPIWAQDKRFRYVVAKAAKVKYKVVATGEFGLAGGDATGSESYHVYRSARTWL